MQKSSPSRTIVETILRQSRRMFATTAAFLLVLLSVSFFAEAVSSEVDDSSLDAKAIAGRVSLSVEQNAWLRKGLTVRARVGSAPPLHMWKDGASGISVDYLNLICDGFDIRCVFVTGIPWPEAIPKISNGDGADVVLTVKRTTERSEKVAFTKDYLFMPWVIFARDGGSSIKGIDDLDGKAVAVEEGFVLHGRLKTDYPGILLQTVPTTTSALRELATGRVDAYVGNLTTGAYLARREGFANIRVVASTPFGSHNQAMAVRPDWPELVGLINGFLDAMTPREIALVSRPWLPAEPNPAFDTRFLVRLGLWSLAALAAIGVLVAGWIVTLRRTVRRQTAALSRAHDDLEVVVAQRTAELHAKNTILESIIESSRDSIFVKDRNSRLILVNRKFAEIHECSPESMIGLCNHDFFPPDVAAATVAVDRAVMEGGLPIEAEDIIPIRGQDHILKILKSPYRDADGNVVGVIGLVRDVTERRHAERARRESEARLRSIMENAPAIIYLKDFEGRLLTSNKAHLEFHGFALSEAVGLTTEDYDAPEDAEENAREERLVAESGETRVAEIHRRRADAEDVHLMLVRFPVSDDRGTVIATGGIGIDISPQKRAESRLATERRRLNEILEATGVGTWEWDLRSGEIEINDQWARILGYEVDELRPITIESATPMVHPDDIPGSDAALQAAFTGESPTYEAEIRLRHKNGKWVWTMQRGRVVERDSEGNPLRISGTSQDINEKRLAENALRDSEELYRLAFRTSPDSININRLSDGLYVDINDGFTAMTGFTREDSIGKTSEEIGIWADMADRNRLATELRRNGSMTNLEAPFRRKDGSILTALMSASVIHLGGEAHLLSITRDITDIRQTEERLRQAQKMEAVGQLTGGIAHDFNNLLQIVETSLDILRSRIESDALSENLVNAAIDAGRRGARLTQQLLSFSRKQTLSPQEHDLNALIENISTILTRTLGEDIRIEIRLEPDAGIILVDENGLQNALLNLALNARAAMPEGGRLTIASRQLHLATGTDTEGTSLPAGDYVEIVVSDTGCGMSQDILERAFEPFFTTKDVGEGSGLGLSMVYGFARQSGGDVAIDSRVGGGSTVRLLLPAVTGSSPSDIPVATSPQPSGGARKKLLVVEDDPSVRASACLLLESLEFEVREAEDAEAALAILDAEPDIQLLFTDMVMPKGMNGLDLAREARRGNPDIRVIIVSGYPDAELKKSGASSNEFHWLRKPYTREQLAEALAAGFQR